VTDMAWVEAAASADWGRAADRHRWKTPGELAAAVMPGTVQTPALDVIDEALVDVEAGRCARLIISMPPQEGKSTRVTTAGPLWFLTRNPDRRIALVSYAQDLADDFSRTIRNLISNYDGEDGTIDLGLRIAQDNGAARRWKLADAQGGVRAVGVGAGLTGRPVDALFIDDPISNMEQAQSSTYREKVWRWWQSVGVTRLAPGAPVVLVLTRWHEDDLAGRLLREAAGNPLLPQWRVVSIPAVADSPDDVLGREVGEPMRSARDFLNAAGKWVRRDFKAIRQQVGEYVWSALYQQRPTPGEGGLFKRAQLGRWSWAPDDEHGQRRFTIGPNLYVLADCDRFLTVDLAASTKTSADYTAVGVWAVTTDGQLVLLDGLLDRVDPTRHFDLANGLREKWGAATIYVEQAWMTSTMSYDAGRAGVPLQPLDPDKDKYTRAIPASALTGREGVPGRLWFPPETHGEWVSLWLDQLVEFPNGAHDDAVDVTAYAARVMSTRWVDQVRVEAMTRVDEALPAEDGWTAYDQVQW